jgi:hypothetical protein
MARRTLTNWHYCEYGNHYYKGILCAECSEEMSGNFRKERQQGKAKIHIAREFRKSISHEASVPKVQIPRSGQEAGEGVPENVRSIPTDCFQISSTRNLTPWQKAHNYAISTIGSWNYKQSPYCSFQECYNAPVLSLLNRTCWCEIHRL